MRLSRVQKRGGVALFAVQQRGCTPLAAGALGRVDVPPASVYVCNLHFTRECFSNYAEVEMGFKKQLLLNPDAVPAPVRVVTEVSEVSNPENVK